MASRGCAQAPDGKLLDASEIQWYNDMDSDKPIPPFTQPGTNSGSSLHRHSSVSTIDHFFALLPQTSGSRQSACVPQPSIRSTDPNNAMIPDPAPLKRKGSSGLGAEAPSHRARKVIVDSSDDKPNETTKPNLSDPEPGVDVDGSGQDSGAEDAEEATAAYQYTKSLGDADREVRNSSPSHDLWD
jgi:hypothetical protein